MPVMIRFACFVILIAGGGGWREDPGTANYCDRAGVASVPFGGAVEYGWAGSGHVGPIGAHSGGHGVAAGWIHGEARGIRLG